MSKFESGVSGYINAMATVYVGFPIDQRGNQFVNCSQCYYFSNSTNRCRLNGEICEFPNKYVGSHCPLEFIDNTEER